MKPGNEPGEDFDTRRIHGSIMRETQEPREMFAAAPWWLKHCIYAPLCIWGIWYLLVASGGFRWNEYSEQYYPTVVPETTDEPAGTAPPSDDPQALIADGETVYTTVCAACHQPDGKGLPGAFPPLAGSDWVAGVPEKIILPVLHGLGGEIVVNGETWNGVMPAQGANLDDREIASVISYVRASWGNSASPVTPDSVTALREKFKDHAPWTEDTLNTAVTE